MTLEIVYEGRTHNAEVKNKSDMDAQFADVFSDYNLDERLKILGFGSRTAYLEAETTIQAKAHDMVKHYLTHVWPNGYKAQIVATSREAAVRYKKHIDAALLAANVPQLKSDVVISGSHNDGLHLKAFTDNSQHEAIIKSFKLPFGKKDDNGISGDVGIIIVNNMLLTGFDAPIEQVMYLDKVMVAHGLLQAIARVNRVGGQTKDKGFVVDYVGIGHHLKKALDSYDEREQKELTAAISFPEDELRELQASHTAITEFLALHGLTNLTDHDAFFDVFYNEDVRFTFMALFKVFTKNLNLVFPARQALDHMNDYQALVAINELAAKHFRDARLSMKGIPPKLRQITDAFLVSQGIDVKVKPISILDEDFQNTVKKHDRLQTKAAAIEHAVRNHLEVSLHDDPELQASFADALAQIFLEFEKNWAKIYEELEKLRQRLVSASQEPTYGLSKKKQMPFFRMLRREIFGETPTPEKTTVSDKPPPALGWTQEDQISALVALTQHVYAEIEKELKLTGFWESIPARNKLEADLQKILLQPEFMHLPNVTRNRRHIISRMMEIAKNNNDTIQFAKE